MATTGSDLIIKIWLSMIVFMPAFIANMFPVIFLKTGVFRSLRCPIDFGMELFGQRVFGEHKTFYGILMAAIGGAVGAAISELLYYFTFSQIESFNNWFPHPSKQLIIYILFGVLIGIGAILGDLIKSFFKRRLKIPSGKPWIFFDQVDFIIGAWIVMSLLTPISGISVSFEIFIIAIIITPLLHLSANIIAYKFKLKKVWW